VRALPSAFGGARWPLLIRARAGSRVRAEVGWADCFEDPATPTRQMVGGGGGDWRLERGRGGGWRVETVPLAVVSLDSRQGQWESR